MAAVRAGFAPTSIFPYLTPDNSSKTATEVTAEENLTTASVKDAHKLMLPILDRALNEVLRRENFVANVELKLSDYIGNKILFDENVRNNYNAGLIPQDIAVKQINGLSDTETKEYVEKINSEKQIFGGAGLNDYSEYPAEFAGNSTGRGGNEDTGDY